MTTICGNCIVSDPTVLKTSCSLFMTGIKLSIMLIKAKFGPNPRPSLPLSVLPKWRARSRVFCRSKLSPCVFSIFFYTRCSNRCARDTASNYTALKHLWTPNHRHSALRPFKHMPTQNPHQGPGGYVGGDGCLSSPVERFRKQRIFGDATPVLAPFPGSFLYN